MAKCVSRCAAGLLFLLLSALFSISIGPGCALADFSGCVVSVLDGDTIEVLHNNHSERIRFNGIDCPALRAI
jgi:endonuclease YncB( thermonuclease family)